jgi:hypothetical protein
MSRVIFVLLISFTMIAQSVQWTAIGSNIGLELFSSTPQSYSFLVLRHFLFSGYELPSTVITKPEFESYCSFLPSTKLRMHGALPACPSITLGHVTCTHSEFHSLQNIMAVVKQSIKLLCNSKWILIFPEHVPYRLSVLTFAIVLQLI